VKKIFKYILLVSLPVFVTVFLWNTIYLSDKIIKESYIISVANNHSDELLELDAPLKISSSSKSNFDNINATSVLAFDSESFQTYYKRDIFKKRSIASITKLMTALVALDIYRIDQIITLKETPERIDLPLGMNIGDKVSVSELLESMLVGSKNEAAIVFANEYGYEKFVSLMNEKATVLGMSDTKFSNPSGYYDAGNYSTAEDLRKLSIATLSHKIIRDLVSLKSGTFSYELASGESRSLVLTSTNSLLFTDSRAKGVKTGFTYLSGQSLIGLFESNGRKVITIILNSTNRFYNSSLLMDMIEEEYLFSY